LLAHVHVLSPVWKQSNNADCVASLSAAPALLFQMREAPNRRAQIAGRTLTVRSGQQSMPGS
jgi:hypothetical protein